MGSSQRMAGEVGPTAPLCEAESPKKKKPIFLLWFFYFFILFLIFLNFLFIFACRTNLQAIQFL